MPGRFIVAIGMETRQRDDIGKLGGGCARRAASVRGALAASMRAGMPTIAWKGEGASTMAIISLGNSVHLHFAGFILKTWSNLSGLVE